MLTKGYTTDYGKRGDVEKARRLEGNPSLAGATALEASGLASGGGSGSCSRARGSLRGRGSGLASTSGSLVSCSGRSGSTCSSGVVTTLSSAGGSSRVASGGRSSSSSGTSTTEDLGELSRGLAIVGNSELSRQN